MRFYFSVLVSLVLCCNASVNHSGGNKNPVLLPQDDYNITGDGPLLKIPASWDTLKTIPDEVEITVSEVANPKLKPVSISVYFLGKEARWNVSDFTLYPPDRPGTFVFRTSEVIQKIVDQNKEGAKADIFLCLELNIRPQSDTKKEDYSSVKLKIAAQLRNIK